MLSIIFIMAAGGLGAAYWRARRHLAGVQVSLSQTVRNAQEKLEDMTAQNALDQNMNFLRQSLADLGPPRLAADGLYFGIRKMNGNPYIVDEVRKRYGGAATIFMGDERVATNVESADGGRAVGTRLAAGPVRDQVLGQKKGFRGETQILGEPYVAVYEPIIADGQAIGILFAGTKKSAVARTPPPAGIGPCIQRLAEISAAQAQAAAMSVQLRQDADDLRRIMESERQTLSEQQEVALNQLAEGLGALAAGDLSVTLGTPFTGEYERLRQDFNGAVRKLQSTMRVVVENSQSVRKGSSDITKSLDDLSHRAEQQAAALEQSAAALAEITATVDQTAAGAAEAQGFVAETNAAAGHSTAVLAETVATMSGIETSSKQISNIIGVMDEIAFQTNLLALNAGVEAARAGDSGRGFAVVASEVRALAQRSADAAKEIKQLIVVSREQVTTGVRLVAETTSSLEQITVRVQQLDERIKNFATAARDESTGLQQISAAVTAMDQGMQKNAALIEESTAASHQLATEAAALADQAAHFKIVSETKGPLTNARPSHAANAREGDVRKAVVSV